MTAFDRLVRFGDEGGSRWRLRTPQRFEPDAAVAGPPWTGEEVPNDEASHVAPPEMAPPEMAPPEVAPPHVAAPTHGAPEAGVAGLRGVADLASGVPPADLPALVPSATGLDDRAIDHRGAADGRETGGWSPGGPVAATPSPAHAKRAPVATSPTPGPARAVPPAAGAGRSSTDPAPARDRRGRSQDLPDALRAALVARGVVGPTARVVPLRRGVPPAPHPARETIAAPEVPAPAPGDVHVHVDRVVVVPPAPPPSPPAASAPPGTTALAAFLAERGRADR